VSARVAFILDTVMMYVATRVTRRPSTIFGVMIPARIENLVNGWLLRRRIAIVALIRRIEAGTLRPPRPYKARAARPEGTAPKPARPPGLRMPSHLAWIFSLGPEMSSARCWVEAFLGEADARAMVIAHPRLAALLRPVLRMLGQTEPAWFPATPKRTRAKRQSSPRPASPRLASPRLASTRPAWTRPGGRARAAEERAWEKPAEADTPSEEVARFVERARAHNEAVARQASFPGWIWINGRPAIPPPREDNSPPPPPPESERGSGPLPWNARINPWWNGCR